MKVKLYLLGWVIMICSVISAKGQSLKEVVAQAETDTANVYLPADSLFARFLKEKQIPITACNRMTLLKSGRSKFEHLFEDIKKAENYIHLEYFNFRSDSIAKELFTLLAEKAKEGVTIKALFDDFGNLSNSRPLRKEHLKMLAERGVEMARFSPIRFPYINHVFCRDHQKIVVIDGKVGYTGGMNIADYYINGLPEIGPWRDMHIRIEGPAVQYLEKAFLGKWHTIRCARVPEEGWPLCSVFRKFVRKSCVRLILRRWMPQSVRCRLSILILLLPVRSEMPSNGRLNGEFG